ncbi:MAG: hypothetical protein KKB31_07970 [Nanoarchaeota archaeon]|nr:hypothetical protein [Nanoarchaeota archaeon]
MGDRRIAQIKGGDKFGDVYVYVHSHGYELPEMTENAIIAARNRWDDPAYATRIIVDQLTKDGRDRETGFGLMAKPYAEDSYNNDQPSVIIDLPNQTLRVIGDKACYKTFSKVVM